jgi:hypothetical protein
MEFNQLRIVAFLHVQAMQLKENAAAAHQVIFSE